MRFLFILLYFISVDISAQTAEASTTIPTDEYLNSLVANLELPDNIYQNYAGQEIELTVILTITKEGTVFNPKIQNDTLQLEPYLKEAIENLPKWNPKTEGGVPVLSRKGFKLIIPVSPKTVNLSAEKELVSQHIMRTFSLPNEILKNYGNKKIVMEFYIETDGSISDFKIIESSHPKYNSKLERAIKKIPKITDFTISERIKFPFTINTK